MEVVALIYGMLATVATSDLIVVSITNPKNLIYDKISMSSEHNANFLEVELITSEKVCFFVK